MSAPFQFLMLRMFCIVPYICVIAWRLKQRSVGGPTWYESFVFLAAIWAIILVAI